VSWRLLKRALSREVMRIKKKVNYLFASAPFQKTALPTKTKNILIINTMQKVITRFPPSPTGNLHIGGARTALFNYLYTKHHGGKLYLRLEDTNEARSKPEYEQNILGSLEWLGFSFDVLPDGKPFWRQSERKDIYRGYLKKLIDGGQAYLSKEVHAIESHPQDTPSPRGLSTPPQRGGEEKRRSEVIRFRNPNKKIVFDDLIRGRIELDTTELGDMVIAKSLAEPLYHLAVVIDDHEMGITDVIRGEDHISNTPRQILLQEALGFPRPAYAHIPLILAPDRSKLSKRHGAVSVTEYHDRGYFPDALLNFLALLGWNPGTDQEIFSLGELIEKFDLSKVQKGGAIFNEEKLRWLNKEYMKKHGGAEQVIPHMPEQLLRGKNEVQKNALAEMLFERVSVWNDIETEMGKGEFDYLLKKPEYPPALLRWKKASTEPKAHLEGIMPLLQSIAPKPFTAQEIKETLLPYAEEKGKGDVLWPLRVALSGREKSPDPFTLAAILGEEETLARITVALGMLK